MNDVEMDRFQPRDYQLNLCNNFKNLSYKKFLVIWPRRCLSGNTHIIMENGSWKYLRDIVVGDKIRSWDGFTFVSDTVKSHWKTGIKKTKIVKSFGSLPLISSNDHIFANALSSSYCDNIKWTSLKSLKPRRKLLQYAGIHVDSISDWQMAEFLGYMLGDGYCSGEQQPKFTNSNPEILNRVVYLVGILFPEIIINSVANGKCTDLRFSNGTNGGGAFKNSIKEFYKSNNINCRKSVRRIPEFMWEFDKLTILKFFSGLISSDGNIYVHDIGFTSNDRSRIVPPAVEVTLSCGESDLYAWDIYWLLRRIGIFPQVPYKEKNSNWKIKIAKSRDIKTILHFPVHGKTDARRKALCMVIDRVFEPKKHAGCIFTSYKVSDGEDEELYDIETEKHHNFIANGYLVHNSGKDICALNLLIRYAFKRVGTYFYIFPTFQMGRRILWDAIDIKGHRILNYYIPEEIIESRNEQQMRIRLINGSQIQILGSDDYDTALVGTNAIGMVFSEYALSNPMAYSYAIPILKASDGWVLFVSTPRGKNGLWDLYNNAKRSKDWFVEKLSIEDTEHIDIAEIEKDISEGQMSRDLAMQEYFCFPSGQSVLTDNGVKNIEDVKSNDMVVSHRGRYRKVLDIISRQYSGELIEISSFGSAENIICTPNHPIRVYHQTTQSYSWKEAQYINKEDRLVFPKKHLGSFKVISHELCMLIAWFITEGSCAMNAVQFTVNDKELISLISSLSILNLKFDVLKANNVNNVSVNSVQLVDFFKSECGLISNNKRIPFHLISGYEQEFFHELMKGDGCFNESKNHKKYVYSTVSKSLAYQVQILANSLNIGYAAGISIRDGYKGVIRGRDVNCQQSYQVNISFVGPNESWLLRAKNCIAAKIKDIKKHQYGGLVYNLKIQFDESYIVAGRSVHNCSFDLGVEGSFYAKHIDAIRLKDQITKVYWDPYLPVHTAWDLGYNDDTTIIFVQIPKDGSIRIIDSYSNNKKGLDHYAKFVKEKEYTYGKHLAPFDIAVHDLGTGISRWKMMHDLGITFVKYADKQPGIQDGIEAVRRNIPKMWFDEKKCANLIKAMENYRQEYDDKKKVYKGEALHDWSSHFCFTGDTKILMNNGSKSIKDVIAGDFVKTPFGIRKVLATHKKVVNKITKITVGNTVIECTPDHKIFTQRGLVYSDTLRYTDVMENYSLLKEYLWKAIKSLKIFDIGFKKTFLSLKMNHKLSLMEMFINGTVDIIAEKHHGIKHQGFIEKFGSSIKEKSKKVSMFIMSTTIVKTILYPIYSYLHEAIINLYMPITQIVGPILGSAKNCYQFLDQGQLIGTEVRREENGIDNMRKDHCLQSEVLNTRASVKFVQLIMKVIHLFKDFVVTPVKHVLEFTLKQIMLIAFAVFAKLYSIVINTLLKRHVVKNVQTFQLAEQKWVYDITVDIDNCYYANGYLVSNCDSMRYLCVGLPKLQPGTSPEELEKRYNEAMYGNRNNLPGIFGQNGQRF